MYEHTLSDKSGGTLFQDDFSTKNVAGWVWSDYQTVPFHAGENSVVLSSRSENTWDEHTWDANFFRSTYGLAHGRGLQLRFQVDGGNTISHFLIEAEDSIYRRFGAVTKNDKLFVQSGSPDELGRFSVVGDLFAPVAINTWYVLRITVDDEKGFTIQAHEEQQPDHPASITAMLPPGRRWRFHHWIYTGQAMIADYSEFVVNQARVSE